MLLCVAPIDFGIQKRMLPVSRKWRSSMGYFIHAVSSYRSNGNEKAEKNERKEKRKLKWQRVRRSWLMTNHLLVNISLLARFASKNRLHIINKCNKIYTLFCEQDCIRHMKTYTYTNSFSFILWNCKTRTEWEILPSPFST